MENSNKELYEHGRFSLRKEDHAIIDELEEYPPILIQIEDTCDGSESQYADRSGVLYLLNLLADNNPNEHKHYFLKTMLDKSWAQRDRLNDENEALKETVKKIIVNQYNHVVEAGEYDPAEYWTGSRDSLVKISEDLNRELNLRIDLK